MSDLGWLGYLWSCGLLILPILAWNLAVARYLPPQFDAAVFDRDIPLLVSVGENGLRMVVFVLPFFMPLDLTTTGQHRGLWLFAGGAVVYLLAWIPLVVAPQSAWSTSRAGFLAPSYTPLIWLVGLGFTGSRFYVPVPFLPWVYPMLACAFVAVHVTHVNLVYTAQRVETSHVASRTAEARRASILRAGPRVAPWSSPFRGGLMAIRISEAGYWSGLVAASAAATYGLVQVLQVAGLLRFPVDEILIYGSSLCIVVPFILEMAAFHHLSAGDRRYWTHAALLFTVVYAVFVTANYVVQLATVIPARLHDAGDALRLLEQTPHSLFWDYDAIGYIAMGLATLVAIPALEPVGAERGVRRAFIAHAAVTPLIAVVYFAPTFSNTLLFLGFPWVVTAPLFMWRLARLLRGRTASRREACA